MRKRFIDWNPQEATKVKVVQANDIINEYLEAGLRLTLRQLYYQFVSRDMIPNNERSYKNLGNMISKARLAGLLDWDAIEDRGREPDIPSEWSSIGRLVAGALYSYRLPRWEGQPYYAELWVEKEALAGVLEPMASKYHVTLMVNKGYSSQSAMYESANRISIRGEDAEDIFIYYLGDHDPSGEDMVRDIRDRLNMFTRDSLPLHVEKIAITTEQVEEHSPPPNPTKLSDSRAQAYIERHGHECWEVDALEPALLQRIISEKFDNIIDFDMMDEIKEREEHDKEELRKAAENI